MKYNVIGLDGSQKGSMELEGSIFGLEVRNDILARVMHWQLAKRRSGTHSSKEIGDVRGSTKKIVRQKGSGGARHGSKRGAQFRGGGIIFGPHFRSHAYSLPKKVRALGLKMALSAKVKTGSLIIIDSAEIPSSKTKDACILLKTLAPKNACIIDGTAATQSMTLAVANLHGYDILPTVGANVYDIIRKETLILTKDGVAALGERLK